MDLRPASRYVIISPVRDEVQHVEKTLASVVAQTVRPVAWVIVDDGSTDGTTSIVEAYASKHDWITMLKVPRGGRRQPGAPVIHAFNCGLGIVQKLELEFEFLVKLDCDLDLPRDYFERLLAEFQKDPALGIASGVYAEKSKGTWVPVGMPEYHAAGASKIFRRECFVQIGGFVAARGWDTVDEIRAQAKGWRTRHFQDVKLHHLKAEGTGIGNLRTNAMHGEIYYLVGGGRAFFALKFAHRLVAGVPFGIAGFAMLWGYLVCCVKRRQRLVSDVEAQCYQRMLNQRITAALGRTSAKGSTTNEVREQN